ncbi:MAG: hypothetical protein AB8H47_19820 [Bacteroidia bacterium]
MNRRQFIKNSAAAAGMLSMPYLLPSGRLFARTNDRKANHVVLVLFAGGIRQQESVLQRYLEGSQNEVQAGNILYNLLDGEAPLDKIVYGQNGSRAGEIPIDKILSTSLQQQGTLFREVNASNVGHYGGLNVCLQGTDQATQGLKQRPLNPTIFEYVRRHAGLSATDVWFIGSGIGNSVPLLHHSIHTDYGEQYAANFLAPSVTFSNKGYEHFADGRSYHPEQELEPIQQIKTFLDLQYDRVASSLGGVQNTREEQFQLRAFLEDLYLRTPTQEILMPPVRDNNDLRSIGYAAEVLRKFQPTLTVVNLESSDVCHSNFTEYLGNMHRADHAVGFLWDYIQRNLPQMAEDTIMLVVPECGRNEKPNPIRDENDWFAYDHSDANSQRVFGMMVGNNVPQNLSIGGEGNPIGQTSDIVPTIADILGIKEEVTKQGLIHPSALSWFDRI